MNTSSGQWSGHLQAAQPRTCGPGKCMLILFFIPSNNTVSWNAYQMIICLVLIVVIFLGLINQCTTWNKQIPLRAFITFSWVGLKHLELSVSLEAKKLP
jgi:hypothetical protein